MAQNALGMIETKGYVAALAAADAMVKAANVVIVGRQEVGDGLVAVIINGRASTRDALNLDYDGSAGTLSFAPPGVGLYLGP